MNNRKYLAKIAPLKSFERRAQLIDTRIGSRLKKRRVELGLSQEDLASMLGITRAQVCKYEAGENRISCGRLFELAQLLRTPLTWFFDIGDDPTGKAPNELLSDEELLHGVEAALSGMRSSLLKMQLLEIARLLANVERTRPAARPKSR